MTKPTLLLCEYMIFACNNNGYQKDIVEICVIHNNERISGF